MKRRAFITLLGGVAAAWPLAARAQQPKVPTIGVLLLGTPEPAPFLNTLRKGLADLGYAEGRNIRFEIRTAEGKASLLPELSAELVRLKVDVIVAFQTPASMAAKQATSEIPIVMAPAGDPVGSGLVANLARPGGNVTGFSAASAEVAGKSVELIREFLPSARRIAVLASETDAYTEPFLMEIGRAARSIGMEMHPVMSGPPQPLDAAFETMVGKRVDAVIIQGIFARKEVIELATKHRLPSFASSQWVTVAGGLMTYAANQSDLHRRAGDYIDRILKGAKPADLPVQLPTKFELVINLKTAKALGITVPATLLARADEVIE